MRAKTLVALLVTALMMTPVQAGDVTAMQDEPAEDPKQPDADNQTMYMYFNGSNGDVAWTHFQNMDNDSEETYMDENENGQINVDISFRMTPELSKRIYIEEDGLIRGSFKINVQGDWTNDADSATACGQNDCEELNITLMAGPNIIGKHHETGLVQGDNTVVFNFQMEEDTVVDWNKKDFNPVVKVEMKLQGNYDDGGIFGIGSGGDPASFSMNMGTDSFLELPIDMASWDESFQDGGELGAEMEDTPGFTLVVASAAIAMAVFVNIGKEEEKEEELEA
jgi:hypothetical protein